LRKFVLKNLVCLIALVIGAYITGVSLQMLAFFVPLLQVTLICLGIGIFLMAITEPKLFIKKIYDLITKEKNKDLLIATKERVYPSISSKKEGGENE